MQISVLVALTLLVLTAVGFLVGRRRALSAGQGRSAALHSLPNYYGYYIALWTGAPALFLLAVYGVFGGSIVNTLAMGELEREAAPLIAAYEESLKDREDYQALARRAADIEARITALREEIAAMDGAAQAEQALRRLGELTAERNDVAAARQDQRAAAAADIAARAPDSAAGRRALAGFEYWRAPSERRELFIADARALAFNEGLASRDTPTLHAAAQAMVPWETLFRWSAASLALALAVGGLAWGRSRVHARFRARNRVEGAISAILLIASIIAILTTLGIVFSLLFESLRFFAAIDWRIHEPANRHPGRPGRPIGRLRCRASVRGHRAHHGDRHGGRGPGGFVRRDLPVGIRRADPARLG